MQRLIRFEDVEHFDHRTDVVVAGFGGAGASAALEARRAGSEVTVLERTSAGGGSTMMSACEMYLGGSGGTALQKDLGFSDSTENFYNYLKECFGDNVDEERLKMYTEGGPEHFDWCEAIGVKYNRGFFPGRDVVAMTGDSLQYTGNERSWPFTEKAEPVPRGHLPADADHNGGQVFMSTLLKRVEESGADIRVDARITALIQDKEGCIRGCVAKINNKPFYIKARQGVVLTAGGFVMNTQMTQQHLPRFVPIDNPHGNPGDMGDGIVLGVAAGGNAINMGEAFICVAHYPPPQLTFGIFVNKFGQRFINEDIYLARMGHYAMQQEEKKVYMLIDNEHFERPAYADTVEIVAVGETIEELETDAQFPVGSLQATVSYYNQQAETGQDPLFHKAAEWLKPIKTAPFALVSYSLDHLNPAIFTLGGLDVKPTGEVLTPDKDIIPGLFAAGRTVAGIPRTAKGYASGMSVGDATFFGRKAGQTIANAKRF
ncbi:MAG: FAD-dependent oxidoreductase [Pseudomonadales bacterium]